MDHWDREILPIAVEIPAGERWSEGQILGRHRERSVATAEAEIEVVEVPASAQAAEYLASWHNEATSDGCHCMKTTPVEASASTKGILAYAPTLTVIPTSRAWTSFVGQDDSVPGLD